MYKVKFIVNTDNKKHWYSIIKNVLRHDNQRMNFFLASFIYESNLAKKYIVYLELPFNVDTELLKLLFAELNYFYK